MSERTPLSVALVERFAPWAATCLGRSVLPVRAKGVRYAASTAWHRDAEGTVGSVGFLAYTDALDGESGALRVRRGSHRLAEGASNPNAPSVIATEPGDVIVLDECVEHASFGGKDRLQWRIDFVVDPVTPDEEQQVVAYLERTFPPDWDGGYDANTYPSFPASWLAVHPHWATRLRALGAIALAHAQERRP